MEEQGAPSVQPELVHREAVPLHQYPQWEVVKLDVPVGNFSQIRFGKVNENTIRGAEPDWDHIVFKRVAIDSFRLLQGVAHNLAFRELKALRMFSDTGFAAELLSAFMATAAFDKEFNVTRDANTKGVYIVTRYLPCLSMHYFDKVITLERAEALLSQLYDAIVYMREFGVSHRDIKPANLLIDDSGAAVRLVLIDFGECAPVQHQRKRHGQFSTCGTFFYAAPELVDGGVSSSCDFWSLAAVAVYFMQRMLPDDGKHTTLRKFPHPIKPNVQRDYHYMVTRAKKYFSCLHQHFGFSLEDLSVYRFAPEISESQSLVTPQQFSIPFTLANLESAVIDNIADFKDSTIQRAASAGLNLDHTKRPLNVAKVFGFDTVPEIGSKNPQTNDEWRFDGAANYQRRRDMLQWPPYEPCHSAVRATR